MTVHHIANQSGMLGRAARLVVAGRDSAAGSHLLYTATGLPTGLRIDARTGAITGRPTHGGTFHVTIQAKDETGAAAHATFTWTVRTH